MCFSFHSLFFIVFPSCLLQLPPFPPSGQQTMYTPADYMFPLRHRGSQLPAGHNNAQTALLPHPARADGHHHCSRRPRRNRSQR